MNYAEENMTPEQKMQALRARRPSQDLTPSIHEAFAIAEEEVAPVKRATHLQWGVLGVIIVTVGSFLSWSFIDLIGVHTAQAQTAVKADAGLERVTKVENGLVELNTRVGGLERTTIRLEVMAEMQLRAQGITPPPKADGGGP